MKERKFKVGDGGIVKPGMQESAMASENPGKLIKIAAIKFNDVSRKEYIVSDLEMCSGLYAHELELIPEAVVKSKLFKLLNEEA